MHYSQKEFFIFPWKCTGIANKYAIIITGGFRLNFDLLKNSQAVKSGAALKSLGEKVGKSKVAAKNDCNDVNANKF